MKTLSWMLIAVIPLLASGERGDALPMADTPASVINRPAPAAESLAPPADSLADLADTPSSTVDAPPSPAASPASPACRPERLVYTAQYNWAFIWIEAGIVEFTLSPSKEHAGAQRLFAVGRSTKDWIFRVRDTLVSHHDPDTFLPRAFSRVAHEGNYHKTFDYRWDYNRRAVYSRQERLGRNVRLDTIPLLPDTHDILSAIWMVRRLDFPAYQKNDLIPMRVLLDDKIYNLYVRYLGRERVKVSKEKRWCHVFSPLLVEGEVFKGGESMKVWVSDDEYRLPLMVEAKIVVGSVKITLEEAKSTF
ncbi:MAG: DUF3108 domain-containing protein [Odoribacteraceae bacterium]|nr:DUF3108 domain-containing protein [Odoribacteraceae bacterium]